MRFCRISAAPCQVLPLLFAFTLLRSVACHSLVRSDPSEVSTTEVIPHPCDCVHHVQYACPPGFISCAGKCYQRLNVKTTYWKAKEYCQQAHPKGMLAVPRSREENQCAAGLSQHADIWLGVNDLEPEGLFVGEDGRGVADTVGLGPVWSDGQPNNHNNQDNCVEIWTDKGFGEWNDRPCNYSQNYPMCQIAF